MNNFLKIILFKIINWQKRAVLNKKINAIYKNVLSNQNDHSKVINNLQHNNTWKKFSKRVNSRWFAAYSNINGNTDSNYMPESIYYLNIEPVLNKKPYYKTYSDKNFYNLFYREELFPKTVLRKINNSYYDSLYNPIDLNLNKLNGMMKGYVRTILKPSIDSGGGDNVLLMNRDNGRLKDSNGNILDVEFLNKFSSDFVIQEYIDQHEFYKRFNKSSVNTVRILTYRDVKTEEIHILQSVLRIGKPGSYVDNQAAGGIACGVDDFGVLRSFAVDKMGNKYLEQNEIEFKTVGELFKFYDMCSIAKDIARKNLYFRLLSFDFCVDAHEKVILIEINNMNHEINFYQMTNGPLFKNFTNEVIDFCKHNPVSVSFDYSI